jgi:hypothetical protein
MLDLDKLEQVARSMSESDFQDNFEEGCIDMLHHPEDLLRATTAGMQAHGTLLHIGMEGTNLELICKFIRKFDDNVDSLVDLKEFKKLIMVTLNPKP